ncbi:MAG: TetR/AcrR family transcriptional regulator [Polyangiaceae bacterium]
MIAGQRSEPDKGEAILTAALDLFVERGFYGTSVPSVAERAGVAAGTIYHYFASKEALVNALFKRWKGEVSGEVLRDFPFDRPPREQFRAVWERMTTFALAHPKELAFLELHHHGSYLDEESRRIEHQILDFGIEMVRRAQAAEALKPMPPGVLMEFANGAFLGVFRGALEGRLEMARETFTSAERCCWEALRA